MVCTDQATGERRGAEPLLTLASFRRRRGRVHFGVLLSRAAETQRAAPRGDEVPQDTAGDELARAAARGVDAKEHSVVYLSVGMPVTGL
jgi:hypothetical protein